jgi:hypothetical protein
MIDTKRRRGRPPKPPDQRRPHTLAIRVNDELYQRLRREAEAKGRSLSEEAEALLYGAFEAQARTHEALVGMVARGEVVLQPRSSPRNVPEAAPKAEAPSSGFGSLAEIAAVAGLTRGLKSGESLEAIKSELFGGMSEVLAFALNAVAANAREAITAAVRETLPSVVRDELAAVPRRQPGGSAGASKDPADSADSTPA